VAQFLLYIGHSGQQASPVRTKHDGQIRGDLIMRAAVLVAGCFLVASSTFAAEPQMRSTATKPVVVATVTGATHEKSVPQGSLEMFGSVGLPQ
jgi:hypothetical protein